MIQTLRLRLRPLTLPDASWVAALAGDERVADTLLAVPHPYPEGLAEAFIRESARGFSEGWEYNFGLWRGDIPVGVVGLSVERAHRRGVLGYWVGVPYWGQEYATEAVRALVAYGFRTLGLERIEATCFVRNPASARVLEKAGLLREGLLRGYVLKNGQREDVYVYGLLREDWHGKADPDF